MRSVTIRHFTAQDIPLRTELLREGEFQANLTDFAVLAADDALAADQRSTLAEGQQAKRIFTVCTETGGRVVGFVWITSIDWPSQVCELSVAVLPAFRVGLGLPAVNVALRYLHDELNMETVVSQVLAHNTNLQSEELLTARGTVACPYDSYTVGQWRTSLYWGQSRAEFAAECRLFEDRRRHRGERIRTAVYDSRTVDGTR
jgi:hypothetical protein